MAFTQTMTVQGGSKEQIAELIEGWHKREAGTAPGYQGARVLEDRDHPGRYVIEVDFSSEEQAQKNNAREETQAWAKKLQELADGDPEYGNFAVAYTTG